MFEKFNLYLDYLEFDKGVAESTFDTRERALSMFSDFLRTERGIESAEDVTRRDVSRFVEYLVDEDYAYQSIMDAYYASISACFNQLHRDREIAENPIDRIEWSAIDGKASEAKTETERKNEHGPKDHLTKDEVYRLAKHAPTPRDRNALLIKLLFWTGCRISEALRINIGEDGTLDGPQSDINPDKPAIKVYAPKTDDSRTVSYPSEEINPLLRDWVRNGRLRYKCADDTSRLFIGREGPIGRKHVEDMVHEAAEDARLQESQGETKDGQEKRRVTPHILRDSHAMHYHNVEDVPLDYVKDHLGHKQLQTTEEYYAEATEEKIVDTFGE